jgi:hypothetical protein
MFSQFACKYAALLKGQRPTSSKKAEMDASVEQTASAILAIAKRDIKL